MDLLGGAVANNVAWCSAVCGGTEPQADSARVWLADGQPPPLFPDAVTLRAGVLAAQMAGLLDGRRTCSVKDSYADVDLAPFGFAVLFDAQWIGRPAASSTTTSLTWSQVTGPADLAAWCDAADLPRSLPAHLLADPAVQILMVADQNSIRAGAIANIGGEVVGVSNVFGTAEPAGRIWDDLAPVVAGCFPGLPIVGYERGDDLNAALAAGFSALGPLRVWVRPANP